MRSSTRYGYLAFGGDLWRYDMPITNKGQFPYALDVVHSKIRQISSGR